MNQELKYYMIGMLQGDGHHSEASRNRGRVSLELSSKDNDIIQKLKSALSEWNPKVSGRNRNISMGGKEYASASTILSIHGMEFRKLIKPYVPVGSKSKIVSPPQFDSEEMKAHYVRGYFDANGSIGMTRSKPSIPFISFTINSDSLKEFVVKSIFDVVGAEKRINRNKRDDIYNICLYREDAILYARYLYNGSTLYMDRKRFLFDEIQKWSRTIPKRKGRQKSWLPHEDELIMSDMPIDQMTSDLNRSVGSIKTRMWRLSKRRL